MGSYLRGTVRGITTPDTLSSATFTHISEPSAASAGVSSTVASGQTSRYMYAPQRHASIQEPCAYARKLTRAPPKSERRPRMERYNCARAFVQCEAVHAELDSHRARTG